MGKNQESGVSRVDAELPLGGDPLKASLATGSSFQVRVLPVRRWIDIDLVDELGQPAAGEVYRVALPDGTVVKEGKLDDNGCARVEGLSAEECVISFPLVDLPAWSYLGYSE